MPREQLDIGGRARAMLAEAKAARKEVSATSFAFRVYAKLGPFIGYPLVELKTSWCDQEDRSGLLLHNHPELAIYRISPIVVQQVQDLLRPVKDYPAGLWGTFIKGVSETPDEPVCVVFRVKSQPWALTNEALVAEMFCPMIQITTPPDTEDVHVMSMAVYLEKKYGWKKETSSDSDDTDADSDT